MYGERLTSSFFLFGIPLLNCSFLWKNIITSFYIELELNSPEQYLKLYNICFKIVCLLSVESNIMFTVCFCYFC